MYDKIIDAAAKSTMKQQKPSKKNFSNKYWWKKVTCETKIYIYIYIYILLDFLLITIAFLIAVSMHRYLIKYSAKEEHFVTYHVTNNKLEEVSY